MLNYSVAELRFFVLAVWFLYKKAYRLQQVNRSEKTDQLVGRESTIYFKHGDGKYTVQMKRDGAIREIDVVSESGKTYQTGDRTIITAYKDGILYIHFVYLQLIIPQYFISNKSGIWSLSLIVHSKG